MVIGRHEQEYQHGPHRDCPQTGADGVFAQARADLLLADDVERHRKRARTQHQRQVFRLALGESGDPHLLANRLGYLRASLDAVVEHHRQDLAHVLLGQVEEDVAPFRAQEEQHLRAAGEGIAVHPRVVDEFPRQPFLILDDRVAEELIHPVRVLLVDTAQHGARRQYAGIAQAAARAQEVPGIGALVLVERGLAVRVHQVESQPALADDEVAHPFRVRRAGQLDDDPVVGHPVDRRFGQSELVDAVEEYLQGAVERIPSVGVAERSQLVLQLLEVRLDQHVHAALQVQSELQAAGRQLLEVQQPLAVIGLQCAQQRRLASESVEERLHRPRRRHRPPFEPVLIPRGAAQEAQVLRYR